MLRLTRRRASSLERRRLLEGDACKVPRIRHRPRIDHGQVAAGNHGCRYDGLLPLFGALVM